MIDCKIAILIVTILHCIYSSMTIIDCRLRNSMLSLNDEVCFNDFLWFEVQFKVEWLFRARKLFQNLFQGQEYRASTII